jgi:hypothetical protein
MGALLLVLMLALALFGLAFTLKILIWVALACVVLLVGMIRPAEGHRFYRWGYR